MKRTKNRLTRTNYLPVSASSNEKKIIKVLEQMAVANAQKDKKLYKELDHQLHKLQRIQIKLDKK